jgi:hypothetical protein
MPRIIVNEGEGARPVDLVVSRLVVGGSSDCDVRLRHPATAGAEFIVEAVAGGHRVVRLRGELLLNEEPCDVAMLQHGDTLRVGESMILYKNPAARRAAPPPAARAMGE